MKKFIFLLVLALASCTRLTEAGDGTLKPDIRFSPSEVVLEHTARLQISFRSPYPWSSAITEGEDWLAISGPISGAAGDVTVTIGAIEENPYDYDRTGIIRITINKYTYDVKVTQPFNQVIEGETSKFELSFAGGEITVHTQANVEYEIEPNVEWIVHTGTKALNEADETFSVLQNQENKKRVGRISFKSSGATFVVTVTQGGKDPFLNVTEPGFYGISGRNYLKGKDGWTQSSFRTGADGALRYRLLDSGNITAVTVIGPNEDNLPDQKVSILVSSVGVSGVAYVKEMESVFLYSKDGLYWYKTGDNAGVIMEKHVL